MRAALHTSTVLSMLLAVGVTTAAPSTATVGCRADDRDVIVGVPSHDGGSGAVDVQQYGATPQLLTRETLSLGSSQAGDEFGRAVAASRTGDGCALLAIGAPGALGQGVVYLALDTPSGFTAGPHPIALVAPNSDAGDRFGETVLFSRSTLTADEYELWVGAPRRDVGAAVDAGAVEHYRVIVRPGSDDVSVTHVATLRQGDASIPGTTAESNDRFGEVLAPGERGVVVGVPHENIGSAVDAGLVVVVSYDRALGRYRGFANLTQDTTGIGGTPETGDLFGAAVAACAELIGAPGEDIGSVRDAGLVQAMTGCGPVPRPGLAYTQSTSGVPGANEAGDRFGASVTVRSDPGDGHGYVVGVPGEDLGIDGVDMVDAGVMLVERPCGERPCRWSSLRQGAGLPGTTEAGDQTGATVAVRQFYPGEGDAVTHSTSWPYVSAPGEDRGTVPDAGLLFTRTVIGGSVSDRTLGFSGGAVTGMRYGTVLAADVYGYPQD